MSVNEERFDRLINDEIARMERFVNVEKEMMPDWLNRKHEMLDEISKLSKYPPAEPGALVLEPLEAAYPCCSRSAALAR